MLKGLKGKIFSFYSMLLFSVNNTLNNILNSFEKFLQLNAVKINLAMQSILISKTIYHTNNI